MTQVQRDVCTACGAVWFPGTAHGDLCPSCKGVTVANVTCEMNDAGVVTKPLVLKSARGTT